MSQEHIALFMFASMMLMLISGQRVFGAIGAIAAIAAIALWGTGGQDIPFAAALKLMKWYPLLTLPMFIFMGYILSETRLADDLYRMFHVWFGKVNGGLAMGTIGLMVLISAMNGLSVAGMAIGATIALPELLRRGYNKLMVTGVVQAGSSLGILVPPSVVLVLYAMIARQPVGQLWLAGILPGLMMAALFVIYIWIRCRMNPSLGPVATDLGSVSAEFYLLSTKNSRGKKVIQIKFTSPVQGIEKRHFYANTRVTDFYGEYDDYFVELQPFPEGEERTTRIALIADYYFNAEVNRVIFVPIEIYAEFPADATAGSQASVSYGTLNSNFVESLRQASAYIPPSAAAPVTVVTTEETANVLNPTLSPIVSDSKLPGDVRDMSVKPPAEWQWGLVFNAGINSGGTELVYSDPSTEPQIDVSTVTDFPTFGGGIRWGTDQQFWQFQALLDYSSESFETSDSSSTFTRADIHLQWIYPISGWSSMPFVRTFGVAAGLTHSIPSIEHSGNITTSTLYSRATDLGSSTGFNYSIRWTAPNGSSIFEYRSVVGLDYNAAFMSGDTADLTVADTVSGDYTGFFYSYVFQ